MAVSGLGVAYATAGFVLLYSGWANVGLKDTLTGFLQGKAPTPNPTGAPTIGVTDANAGSGQGATGPLGTTDSAIANDAVRYVGDGYSYGGPSSPGKWDCSSFVNYVLGHDLSLALPGGSWASVTQNGTAHGPNTLSYLAWTGATTIGNSASQAQAGDLLVWQSHMGIALGNGQMVSALNEQLGVKVTSITDGAPGGELLFVRRVKLAAATVA